VAPGRLAAVGLLAVAIATLTNGAAQAVGSGFTRYQKNWQCVIPVPFLAAASAARPGEASLSAARPENRIVLNIEPTAANPRNSEGSFVTLLSGRILFYYTQFYGGSADDSPARIVGIHSDDGGRSWSRPKTIVENEGRANVMSVSLLRLCCGKIALFYLRKNSRLDCRPWMRVSIDEGRSWSEPKSLVETPGYYFLNNDRVVRIGSGRLVVPLAYHPSRGDDPQSAASFDPRAAAVWYYSDDEGTTWRVSDSAWSLPAPSVSGLQEPGVVELAEGGLWSWARTDQGSQYGCSSRDAGKTWTKPAPTSLLSPLSPASVKRLPGSADLLAVYNDHGGEFPFERGKRTPLVAAISFDDGRTWSLRKALESDPDGWYCYTAIHFVDRAVLLAYCAGDPEVGGLNRLRIRRVDIDWLRESVTALR
jgi:sialidase-1